MRTFGITATLWIVFAPAAAGQTLDEERIREARARSNQAIARQDVPEIVSILEPDVHVSTSSGAFLSDRDEMAAAFADQFAEFADARYVRTPETVDVDVSATRAAETGVWVGTWTTPAGPFRTGGRYMAYWRKTRGEWGIHAELFVPLFCEGEGCA